METEKPIPKVTQENYKPIDFGESIPIYSQKGDIVNIVYKMFATKEAVKQRVDICKTCEYFDKIVFGSCKVCGCLVKLKAHLAGASCPVDKWDKTNHNWEPVYISNDLEITDDPNK